MSNNFETELDVIKKNKEDKGFSEKKESWGVSLSGGGIRSATFSLGVLQAISEKDKECNTLGDKNTYEGSLLSYFDYLSTVSGGGYIGGFLSSLFLGERNKDKCEEVCSGSKEDGKAASGAANPKVLADRVIRVLSSGIPPRALDTVINTSKSEPSKPEPSKSEPSVIDNDSKSNRFPLAWLRNNGRYLLPSGTGDLTYAVSIVIRNFISLHYMIGIVLLAASLFLVNLRDYFILIILAISLFAIALIASYWIAASFTAGKGSIYSLFRYLVVSFLIFVFSVFLFSLSNYSCDFFNVGCSGAKEDRFFDLNEAVLMSQQFVSSQISEIFDPDKLYDFVMRCDFSFNKILYSKYFYSSVILLVFFVLVISFLYALVMWVVCYGDERIRIMRRKITGHLSFFMLFVFGSLFVFFVDFSVDYLIKEEGLSFTKIIPLIGGSIVYMAKLLSEKGDLLIRYRSMVIKVLAAAGIICLVVIWYYIARIIHDGIFNNGGLSYSEKCGRYWFLFAVLIFAIFIASYHTQFINLSSLQTFYTAKLVRAYLGASNPKRATDVVSGNGKGGSVSEPVAGDDFCMCSLSSTLAPFHIVNVTVNQTDGVMANGGASGGDDSIVLRDRKGRPLAITCSGNYLEGKIIGGVEKLTLGEWLGISGAAFSTAIGRQTSLSSSLLMGLANIRLGYWYNASENKFGFDSIKKLKIFNFFKNNSYLYLYSEMIANFHGARRDYLYLTDGGHYENTGIYELLRSDRNVRFVLGCDNGADPEYQFDDLANLIRLAKADLDVAIEVYNDFSGFPALAPVFGELNAFYKSTDLKEKNPPVALLLKATNLKKTEKVTWIALIKPRYSHDVPIDIWNYVKGHSEFPQEATADQFFDEAQWESYRALGYFQCKKILSPEVWKELKKLCNLN